jgi:hypothetical protein
MDTLFRLAKQQSTWRGLLYLATAYGIHIAPELQTLILGGCFGTVGAMDVMKDESRRSSDRVTRASDNQPQTHE